MASTQSPASSSLLAISDIIDKILDTDKDAPDFDLQQLVDTIDSFLLHCNPKRGKKSSTSGEKLASASGVAATFSEGVSNNVKIIATQISEYSGDEHSTAISVLNAVGNVHWLGLGFLLVAAVLDRFDTINENKEECWRLLKSMNNLATVILRLRGFPHSKVKLQKEINESIGLIVDGTILCCAQKKSKGFKKFFKASKDKKDLQELSLKVKEMYINLTLLTGVQNLSILENNLKREPPHFPNVSHAVGIDSQVVDVVKLLELDEDKPAVAVVVHGIGGSGKTTLADAVWSYLKDKLQGWRYSKIILIKNLEKHPNVEDLQSLILEDLTGFKQRVRDLESGRQSLKEIMEKESIFLYIDNALYIEPLQELLPKEVSTPKKLRLLFTARKTNVSQVMKDVGIRSCKNYTMESLSIDAAIQVLCRKIDTERDANSILKERPQLKKIAEICRCCPLFLEVIGGYISKRENKVEAYEKVLDSLQHGDQPFSSDKEYSFNEDRIMFAYHELERSAQEAFLDICSFFSRHWKWEDVACIAGEEDMKCLEEAALIKRTDTSDISIHDLLLQVGRNKSKDNRLTTVNELYTVLRDEKSLSQIKGIFLERNKIPFHISAEDLDKMSGSLRVFSMGNFTIVKGKCSKPFNKLMYLEAGRVPNLPIDVSKLTCLAYIDYGIKDSKILSQCKAMQNLSSLKVVKCSGDTIGIPEFGHPNKLRRLVLKRLNATNISWLVKFNRLEKLTLSGCKNLEELPEGVGELSSLRELNLYTWGVLKQLPSAIGQLSSLTTLNLRYCPSLQELPTNFEKLCSLQYLNLHGCSGLLGLPCNFENLTLLQYLNLHDCSGLLELPERLGNLTSLTNLNLFGCEKLSSFPRSLGGMTSLLSSDMAFGRCSSLGELPEQISWLAKSKRISFDGCSSLKMIPNQFSKLTCLEYLDFSGCTSLEELCNGFQCLAKLRELKMSGCMNLSCLPEGFGKLPSLEMLDLSRCRKLKELCSDFNCLVRLKKLNLSRCYSLTQLPDCFGSLDCLEQIDLSHCSNLEKLCDDFGCLPSLMSLELSNCEKLGAEWMDSVVSIPKLWFADIEGSELMIQRWMEMRREKQKWNFVVVTNSFQQTLQNTYEERRAWSLGVIISNVLEKEGLLIDTRKLPFYSSSLQPSTPLILIIDRRYDSDWTKFDWKFLAKNLQWLEADSKLSFSIIYVGREIKALTSILGERILAYTDLNPGASLFLDKLFSKFWPPHHDRDIGIFRSSAHDCLGEDGLKCLSAWEDISYVAKDEASFLSRIPRESNIELLRALLVTPETDYLLLHNNQQVKVDDLEGKVVLLLVMYLPVSPKDCYISALKDVYLKMRESTEYLVEVVFIPCNFSLWGGSWEDFQNAVTSGPWPVFPKPELVNQMILGCYGYERPSGKRVVVVDEKGRISSENPLPMIWRWGVEAYPFSKSREEELKKAEWEVLSSRCSFEFVFHKLDLFQLKGMEALHCDKIILVCWGPPSEMMDLVNDLDGALTSLESIVQVLYVGCNYLYWGPKNEEEYEMKRTEMCKVSSLSFSQVNIFWDRIEYLREESLGMGDEKNIHQVRRMVLHFWDKERERKHKGTQIMIVDKNGEMISGMLLRQGNKEDVEQLLSDIKSEGFKTV
ncbi:hypothetical protein KI387_034220 [Taxus chinensis]|uniref:Uncharacterized protein n=1 Tax=Taxus chinensis TaxID=29808 RepID=A0AA38C584_TAXCH|nr:hypothetical protein KI387_034220 [Taxus chinensis]